MKKSAFFLVFFIIIVFSFQQVKATIITVDNNYPKIGDFATLQEAHDAASNEDTIYVYPSLVSYNTIKVGKMLCFIGTGFQSSQAGLRTTLLEGAFEFIAGSGGSNIIGFGGNFNVIIDADNISIKRNKVKSIKVLAGHLGTIISQNFIYDIDNYFLIDVEAENEVFILNNIVKNHSIWYGPNGNNSNNGKGIRANQTTNTTIIINNIIDLANLSFSNEVVAIDIGSSNATAYNNIILIGPIIGDQTEFSNNLNGPEINSVFIDYKNNDYHLKSGSPAIGTGLNGVDMGIYGGEFSFVDGGYPDIPSIYYLDVPLIGTQKDGINITVKAKSN